MGWLPGATMRGIPAGATRLGAGAPTGAVSRMRRVDTRMQPWLKSSGTMGSFLPNGLGQDDGGDGIDWSSAGDISPNLPDNSLAPVLAPDLGLPTFSPNAPALIGPASGPAAPAPSFSYSSSSQMTFPGISAPAAPPSAGAGPTGSGIPGTQPLNPVAPPATGIAAIGNAIASIFKPSTVTPATRTLPGYGGATLPASTILPGVPDTALLIGGGLLLVLAMAGGKK